MKITLALIDDHKLLLNGLKQIFESDNRFFVCYTHTSGIDFLTQYKKEKVDIVVSDLEMATINGWDIANQVHKILPTQKMVFLSMFCDKYIAEKAINYNVNGLFPKDIDALFLLDKLEEIFLGSNYFHPLALPSYQPDTDNYKTKELMLKFDFSKREIELIYLFEKGLSNKEVANQLFLSVNTIETHRKNIFRKANVNSITQLLHIIYR